MEHGHVVTEWVDSTWGAVSVREDLDGNQQIVFTPNREISGEPDQPAVEIVFDEYQAGLVSRALNRARRRTKTK